MSSSPFSEGGALYALGLIHANHGSAIRSHLLDALRAAGTNEVVQHGAALGIGIASMASEDDELYEELKGVLFNDSAVAGEAAALGMGLVMLGSASPKVVEEMLGYAHDTQHEKIIRGLALGLAMAMYGREAEADALVTTLLHDKDSILRYGAMYTLAFAYAGTGSNAALRRTLHVAVSDVSDDVRRAAVTAIGFILAGTPSQCPKVVKLLAESYNPHVRYGATLAVGISCAGTGLRDALDLLSPMLSDPTDFVRQGALIATSMVLMQSCAHAPDSKLSEHRAHLAKVGADKHEAAMARFGAIIATGILDAGGRNVTMTLISKTGHKLMPSIVGMGVFTHFWFWHPLSLFISLALTPTGAIGVNGELAMPKWSFRSNAPPSTFAYPPPSDTKKEAVEEAKAAVLSITGKKKKDDPEAEAERAEAARLAKEKAKEEAATKARDEMLGVLGSLLKRGAISADLHTELTGSASAFEAKVAAEGKADAKKGAPKGAEKEKEKGGAAPMETEDDAKPRPPLAAIIDGLRSAHERGVISTASLQAVVAHKPEVAEGDDDACEIKLAHEVIDNPARVLRSQERHIALMPGSRYVPITPGRRSGIIVLKDTTPGADEELLQALASNAAADVADAADEAEPEPPAPFEFRG